MAMIDHPHAPAKNESLETASERSTGSTPASRRRDILRCFMQQATSDDLWFGYESDMDMAHVWFTVDQNAAISVPVDERLSLLVDDDTEALVGFTIEGFRDEYLRHVPVRDRWLHRIRLRRMLSHEIPMTKASWWHMQPKPAAFVQVATSVARERLAVIKNLEL